MRRDSEPASVLGFLVRLLTVLAFILFAWNAFAPNSWKETARAYGDSFEAAGKAADALQRTSFWHNIGVPDAPKWSDRP